MIQTIQAGRRTVKEPSPYFCRAYALALYLCARGLEPLRAELANDASAVLFVFRRDEVEPLIQTFHALKDKLNDLSTAARTR